MNADSTDLLRLLSTSPAGVGAVSKVRAAGNQPNIESAEFADLLQQAEEGRLSTGIPVSIGRDADVTLSETDLRRLGVAADKAEAAGIRQALVLTDSEALILDVQTRTIVGRAEIKDGVVAGIDGVIRLGGGSAGGAGGTGGSGGAVEQPILPVPAGFAGANPSLASILGARRGATS